MTEPATPPPTHWFTLDWIEVVVEPDPTAPANDDGTVPTHERNLHCARSVGATSQRAAERIRDWHLQNDSWIPKGARRDAGFAPNVSDIYTRMNGAKR